MYMKFWKRALDFTAALLALLVLWPVLLVFTVLGVVILKGNPFFTQARPGWKDENGQETIFSLIKFRSMSNARDSRGELMPDAHRLGAYGRFLRSTSIDELPSLWNVLRGDMALVGPRPQLVRDMTFMTPEQRRRHDVRPGLTGLAQVNGRNNITWEQKFQYDLQYIDGGITLWGDVKLLLQTVGKVLQRSDVVRSGTVSDLDFGDWLLGQGKCTPEEYRQKQQAAADLLAARKDTLCRN